jgi:hypothetical protein
MKMNSIIRKMLIVALLGSTIAVNAQNKIYLGLRVPQLNTTERGQIGAESNQNNAKGQLIFNKDIGKLQYWDGTKWVQSDEADVNVTSNNKTVGVVANGTDFDLSVNAKVVADSLSKQISKTILGDSILKYITQNLDNETYNLGDEIQNYISKNFSTELGDTLLTYITNNFPTKLGDEILKHITENVTQELTDSIMKNVTVTGVRGIEVEGSGTSNVTVKLPQGQSTGQVLTWDSGTSKWQATNPISNVKQVTIAVTDGTFDTENLIFSGRTSVATTPLQVVAIEPVFSNLTMRRHFLQVDATVQVEGNAADWAVVIENRNISSANQQTLTSVVISYICDDAAALTNATQEVAELVGY